MNYPIWELPVIGGGSLIALIAIFHVYISHLAVGGGLFIWLTDLKGYRDNNKEMHTYIYKHTWFFLLLTMVFGGVSGVGIWFIIALVNPAATSSLIHNFVFGWAIEWVFFVCEIVALLIYYYYFNRLDRKNRLMLAFLYFLFAWLSLVVINGILSYMLTPGAWLETQNFWTGIFNESYFSSLAFRSFFAAIIAGLFGYITTVFLPANEFKQTMIKYCTKWLLFPLLPFVLSAVWYFYTVPASIRHITFHLNPDSNFYVFVFLAATVLVFILGVLFTFKLGNILQKVLAFMLLLIGLSWIGGFEYVREIARKPYIIEGYMYSTSVLVKDVADINRKGVLKFAKWAGIKEINPENKVKAGREIFNLECSSCHTINGIRNPLLPKTIEFTWLGMMSLLDGQGKVQTYMPKFVGTAEEMDALAVFVVQELNKQPITPGPESQEITPVNSEIPPFDIKNDKYILLVWNDLGMHCVSDCDPFFVILPPANTLEAQLIERGPLPVLVNSGVKLLYSVEQGYENPAAHVRFWEFAKSNFGVTLEKNVGLFGYGLSGTFKFNEDRNSYMAQGIPVVPYKDDHTFNPYPLFTVQAIDTLTGTLLAETRVVAPVSSEMGCRNCHGGGWRIDSSGVSDETAQNILLRHDRLSGTNLLQAALKGNPRMCQSCHADPALAAEGLPGHLNLSASMHGWHANYMPVKGEKACALCHPALPQGRTRCNRGIHAAAGVTCVNCHGTLDEHALSLLNSENNERSNELANNLEPMAVSTRQEVNPRAPWLNEPDCLTCHVDYEQPGENPSAFNTWNSDFSELYRIRTDNAGIRCQACHGSTHAVYPAFNQYDKDRDHIQPLQYTGLPYPIGSNMNCEVCHVQKMEDPIHHENMYRMFRNVDLVRK